MNAINKAWHERHRMPQKATLEQRVAWYIEHQKNCHCRKIPATLKKVIEDKNKEL